MWFKSIDQSQFNLYVIQEARLNTAYWLAEMVLYLCETRKKSPAVLEEIANHKKQVALMLDSIERDLCKQEGEPRSLVKHQLGFTTIHCDRALHGIDNRFLFAKLGLEVQGTEQRIQNEMAFIRARSNTVLWDDLLEDFNRSVYLIYDACLKPDARQSNQRVYEQARRKVSAAFTLMNPDFGRIKNYCHLYISHLGLSPVVEQILINQQIVDVSALFEVGRNLALFTSTNFSVAKWLSTTTIDSERLQGIQLKTEEKGKDIQRQLIAASLARTNSIRQILTTESEHQFGSMHRDSNASDALESH